MHTEQRAEKDEGGRLGEKERLDNYWKGWTTFGVSSNNFINQYPETLHSSQTLSLPPHLAVLHVHCRLLLVKALHGLSTSSSRQLEEAGQKGKATG